MSMATKSPTLDKMDDHVWAHNRIRGRNSDHIDLSSLIEMAKRRKVIPEDKSMAENQESSSCRVTGTSNIIPCSSSVKKKCTEISEDTIMGENEESSSFSSSVRSSYLSKSLGLSDDTIDKLRVKKTNKLILNHKKLHLVLDLDHTLLNSTRFDQMSKEEEYLKTQRESEHGLEDVYIVDVSGVKLVTKLRPFIRKFLEHATRKFELSINTMGDRDYAQEMAKLLDPKGDIFCGRIVSCSESTSEVRKDLDAVLARASGIIILDDNREVWQDHNQDNVIVMPKYHFFKSSCVQHGVRSSYEQYGIKNINGKPFSELKTDELDANRGAFLEGVLKVLWQVHTMFFSEVKYKENLTDRDVSHVLGSLQEQVLKGCKIVFSGIWPSFVDSETQPLWKLAKRLGATCLKEVDESVAHVVAANPATIKSCWAVKEGKFLVNPKWIDTCQFMWHRQRESDFGV